MSLRAVPNPLPPLAVRVLADLIADSPQELWQLVDRVIAPGIVRDRDQYVRDVLADLIALGMVRAEGQRYWAVGQ